MTTCEFLRIKLDEYNLNDYVYDSNLEYNWIKFYPFRDNNSEATERFALFLTECNVISIEPIDGFLMCRFL